LDIREQRVDLGYKIPEIGTLFENSDTGRAELASLIASQIHGHMHQTDEEREARKWDDILRSALLADHTTSVVLDPELMRSGQLGLVEHDHVTGFSYESTVNLRQDALEEAGVDGLLFSVEANLLSGIQQIRFTAQPPVRERIQKLVDSYFS
jgi:hypothetical protein